MVNTAEKTGKGAPADSVPKRLEVIDCEYHTALLSTDDGFSNKGVDINLFPQSPHKVEKYHLKDLKLI